MKLTKTKLKEIIREELLNEGKQMTFIQFLNDLEIKLIDAHSAIRGKNGGEGLFKGQSIATPVHNLELMVKYVQSLKKKYKNDKTKLTFKSQ